MPDGAHPALGESVQIRTPRRKSQWPYSAGSQYIQKRGAELRIAIMEKVPLATEEPGTLVGGVASHLKHPFGSGMFGQTGETDPARFQIYEKQDVVGGETSPGKHLNSEEVGTCQDGHVGGDEILPGGILASFRCRLDPVTAKDVAHRLIGNRVAEIGQSSDDAVVSPAGVLSGEADDERLCFGRDAGPAWRSTEFGAVELSGNESPIPGEDGIRLGDTGNLLKRGAAEALTDLSEGRSFRIGKAVIRARVTRPRRASSA